MTDMKPQLGHGRTLEARWPITTAFRLVLVGQVMFLLLQVVEARLANDQRQF